LSQPRKCVCVLDILSIWRSERLNVKGALMRFALADTASICCANHVKIPVHGTAGGEREPISKTFS